MNKFIKDQLSKLKIAEISSEDGNTILFKKKDNLVSSLGFSVGNSYHIILKDYILHPYEGFTLHSNWNNDIIPTDNEMNIEVIQVMGKMIKFRGIGIHDGKFWTGWVPISSATIVEVI